MVQNPTTKKILDTNTNNLVVLKTKANSKTQKKKRSQTRNQSSLYILRTIALTDEETKAYHESVMITFILVTTMFEAMTTTFKTVTKHRHSNAGSHRSNEEENCKWVCDFSRTFNLRKRYCLSYFNR